MCTLELVVLTAELSTSKAMSACPPAPACFEELAHCVDQRGTNGENFAETCGGRLASYIKNHVALRCLPRTLAKNNAGYN